MVIFAKKSFIRNNLRGVKPSSEKPLKKVIQKNIHGLCKIHVVYENMLHATCYVTTSKLMKIESALDHTAPRNGGNERPPSNPGDAEVSRVQQPQKGLHDVGIEIWQRDDALLSLGSTAPPILWAPG